MTRYIRNSKDVSQEIGIHVRRGRNLVDKDFIGRSDPYVVIRMGKQWHAGAENPGSERYLNPVWNCHLTLSISDPRLPVKLFVYDEDRFTRDDPLGEAVIDIKPFLAAMGNEQGSPQNSQIERKDGKLFQNMSLKLQNVKSGRVELQLYLLDTHEQTRTTTAQILDPHGQTPTTQVLDSHGQTRTTTTQPHGQTQMTQTYMVQAGVVKILSANLRT